MNKTVNINLAGIFFHIDEDAYLKLQHYLNAIKQSFADSEGQDEIISDIEARIAELFNEHLKTNKQVIRITEVDRIIAIMGQPEDYIVDNTIFDDEQPENTKNTSYEFKHEEDTYTHQKTYKYETKKLFRDTEKAFAGGVSAGLGHYLGIDAIWIRLAWLFLFSVGGSGVLIYIILWVLVPEAKTTAEKIMMTGDPVNISNIEKKIKDSLDNVSNSVKEAANKVNFESQNHKIKSSSRSFVLFLSRILKIIIKIFTKFLGSILTAVAFSLIVSVIVALIKKNLFYNIYDSQSDILGGLNIEAMPYWLSALAIFTIVGIPLFLLLYLGLKLLITNLKPLKKSSKSGLIALWIFAIVAFAGKGIIGTQKYTLKKSHYEKTKTIPITANDTLYVKMAAQSMFALGHHKKGNRFQYMPDTNGENMLFGKDVGIVVKSTSDSLASISIRKNAQALKSDVGLKRAQDITYNYTYQNGTLVLNRYFKTAPENKKSAQEVKVILYLPEHCVVHFSEGTKHHLYKKAHYGNIVNAKKSNTYLEVLDGHTKCLNCRNKQKHRS